MGATVDALPIPQDWTDLNALSGIAAGTDFFLQNVGLPGDVIGVYFSETEPAADAKGWALDQVKEMYIVTGETLTTWVKFYRNDRNQATNSRTGFLQVEANL